MCELARESHLDHVPKLFQLAFLNPKKLVIILYLTMMVC